MYRKVSIILFFTLIFFISYQRSDAISMSNDNYQIQDTQMKVTTLKDLPTSQVVSHDTGYSVSYPLGKAGMELSVGSDSIDFGQIHAGEPLLRTATINVSKSIKETTFLLLTEDHPPQDASDASQLIPDTRCDSGNCSSFISDIWSNPLTFGFGYRCDSSSASCSTQLTSSDSYLQLSHQEKSWNVLSTIPYAVTKSQIQLSLKINVSPSLPFASYQNTLILIETPQI